MEFKAAFIIANCVMGILSLLVLLATVIDYFSKAIWNILVPILIIEGIAIFLAIILWFGGKGG